MFEITMKNRLKSLKGFGGFVSNLDCACAMLHDSFNLRHNNTGTDSETSSAKKIGAIVLFLKISEFGITKDTVKLLL